MKPSTSLTQPTTIPPPFRHSLESLVPILDAFTHRHKNQHRSSHWWPHVNILRRSIRSLLKSPSSATWLNQHVMPKAYLAFSQLAADNQHAPLGLLLITILARVNTVLVEILPTTETSPPDDIEMTNTKTTISSSSSILGTPQSLEDRDRGIAVSRSQIPSTRTTSDHIPISYSIITKTDRPSDNTSKANQDKLKKKQSKNLHRDEAKPKKKQKKAKPADEFSSLFSLL